MRSVIKARRGDVPVRAGAEEQRARLAALEQECRRLAVCLQEEIVDRRVLGQAERQLSRVYRSLGRSISAYTRLRGGPTSEADVVRSTLDVSQQDLAWVQVNRAKVSEREILGRLSHALRGSCTALSLLRWSWAS